MKCVKMTHTVEAVFGNREFVVQPQLLGSGHNHEHQLEFEVCLVFLPSFTNLPSYSQDFVHIVIGTAYKAYKRSYHKVPYTTHFSVHLRNMGKVKTMPSAACVNF